MRKIELIVFLLLFLLTSCSSSEDSDGNTDAGDDSDSDLTVDRERVFDMVDSFGACVNLGNWLEAPNQDWGVICDESDITRIAEMGFKTIRVPIRWETRAMAKSPYTIEESFLELVDDVLDWSEKAGLYLVMDMHHHDRFFSDAEGNKAQFLAMWEQIATRYQDRPESVVFEIMNEPHDTLTAALWNDYLVEALNVIRSTNPNRAVVIGTADWGGIGSMSLLGLPSDPNIIFTFHYYEPFQFTHQDADFVDGADAWAGTTWDATPFEKLELKNSMSTVAAWAKEQDVPVWIGEFGSYSAGDAGSRARWTEHVARFAENEGFSWCYWEYKAGFGLWDQNTESWNTYLTDALFNDDFSIVDINLNELGENLLENGDFEDGTAGWWENFSAGDATATVEDGILAIDVRETSDESWGLQYVADLPPLSTGGSYALLFDSWSDAPRGLDVGVQHMEDPWTVYAYASLSLTTKPMTQVVNFSMNEDDDVAAFVLNVGAATGIVYIDNVHLLAQ